MRKWLQAGILLVYCILIYMVQRPVLRIAAKVGGDRRA